MTKDALDEIIEREGVLNHLEQNKDELKLLFHGIIDAYLLYFPEGPLRKKIISPIIWEFVKWDTKIRNLLLTHDKFDLDELKRCDGPLCERICETILKIIEIDLEDIKFKNV